MARAGAVVSDLPRGWTLTAIRRIFERGDLSSTEKLVAVYLVGRASVGREPPYEGMVVCWPGLTLIARECGRNRETITLAITALERAGVIRVDRSWNAHRSKRRNANRYLPDPSLWAPDSLQDASAARQASEVDPDLDNAKAVN